MKKLLFTLIILTVTAAFVSCGVTDSADTEAIKTTGIDTHEISIDSETADSIKEAETEKESGTSPDETLPNDIETELLTNTYIRTSGDFQFTVDKGKVTVVRYIGKETDVTIPSEIEGMPVVKLGHWILNHGIHGIFDETKVKSLTVPGSVTAIDEFALGGNVRIEKLVLTEGVTGMQSAPETLKEIIIPESLKSFGYNIFSDCDNFDTIYYYGDPKNLRKILSQAGSDGLLHRNVHYYNHEYNKFISSVFDLDYEMWHDKELLNSISSVFRKSPSRDIVKSYVEALHTDYVFDKETDVYFYPFALFLCESSESYDNDTWDIDVRWDIIKVLFKNGTIKYYAYFTVNDDFFHIEEATDGTIYTKEYVLDLVTSDNRYENYILSKKSENGIEHDERCISVNISKISELEAIITKYPSVSGYEHSIAFYVDPANNDRLICKLVVDSDTDQYYYSFSLNVTDFSVSDIRTHNSPEEVLRFVGDPYPEYVEPNYDILYESEKLIVYHAEESNSNSDVLIKNKITGKEHLLYDGLTREEKNALLSSADSDEYPLEIHEKVKHVTVYDDRYIIYNVAGYEWVTGFGIFDTETGESYYSNDHKFLRLCSDRVFACSNSEVTPPFNQDMCYTILDGSGEFIFHDVINADEMFIDTWYYSISPNGKKIVSSSAMDSNTDLPIRISDVDGGDIDEYSISRYPSYSLINDKYYFRYDYNNYYLDSYLLIIPLD